MSEVEITRVLAEWRLPVTGDPVRLEIVGDVDGADSPRINHNSVPLTDSLFNKKDDDYMDHVIYPQADELIRKHFVGRKIYCAKAAQKGMKVSYAGNTTSRNKLPSVRRGA
ncbi:hypothetical protein W02_30920 [Nitrospira sp. KM1]|uniref:hypothetical protein n=1 Tax=Nitrospira sp. KM1 TaxID=1936990 RepID=UPI0013A76462|nr:hypothetical protein [Nitrospira sp. KM1]BCA55952.1 hypothetical protein W02_30920 [Nitrospira sp. KM1]